MLSTIVRVAVAAALACVATAPSIAQAGVSKPAPQIVDKAGDWPVPSMDVLRGRASLANGKSLEALEFRIALAAAPLAPTEFAYGFNLNDCLRYTVGSRWFPSVGFLTPTLTKSTCDSQLNEDIPGARLTVRTEGTDVIFVLRDLESYGIGYLTRIDTMVAWAAEVQAAVFGAGSLVDADAAPGDIGFAQTHYNVGSELTKRRR